MRGLVSKIEVCEMIRTPLAVKLCRDAPDFCCTVLKNSRKVVSGADNLRRLIKMLLHFVLWAFLIELNMSVKYVNTDFPMPFIFL